MSDVRELCRRAAALHRTLAAAHRELAEVQEQLGAATAALEAPEAPDEVLRVEAAAAFMGEKSVTVFLRRPEYRKADLRRPGERIHRYSRRELDRIKGDRLAQR